MGKEVFFRCGMFRGMTEWEIMCLLGCLAARVHTLENNRALRLAGREVAVVLTGALSVRSPFAREGLVRGGAVVDIPCDLLAYSRSEVVVVSASRLFGLCGCACAAHRKALANYAGLCRSSDGLYKYNI